MSRPALALLPDGRVKKERYFPSVTLEAPRASDEASPLLDVRHVPPVTYAWDEAALPKTVTRWMLCWLASPGWGIRPRWCPADCETKRRQPRTHPATAH